MSTGRVLCALLIPGRHRINSAGLGMYCRDPSFPGCSPRHFSIPLFLTIASNSSPSTLSFQQESRSWIGVRGKQTDQWEAVWRDFSESVEEGLEATVHDSMMTAHSSMSLFDLHSAPPPVPPHSVQSKNPSEYNWTLTLSTGARGH